MRVTATSTRKYPLRLKWNCSKCGTENISDQWITAETMITRKNPSDAKRLEMEKKVSEAAVESLRNKVVAFADDISVGDFSEYEFRCSCKKCGNEEAWAKYKFKKLVDNFSVVLLFGGLFGLAGLFDLKFGLLIGVVIVAILFFGTIAVLKRHLLSEVRDLPFDSIPVFYDMDGNEMVAMQKYYQDKKIKFTTENMNDDNVDAEVVAMKTNTINTTEFNQVDFCYRCGAKILRNDAVYCEKCGAKVR